MTAKSSQPVVTRSNLNPCMSVSLVETTIDEVKKVVLFVVSHSRIKELFVITKGPTGIGLRTYPDTRFSYAALMIHSVLTNKRTLCTLPLEEEHWAEITSNSDGTRVAGTAEFEALVGSTSSFWRRSADALKLLQPVSVALRFIEGDYARLSFVYLLGRIKQRSGPDLKGDFPANFSYRQTVCRRIVDADHWKNCVNPNFHTHSFEICKCKFCNKFSGWNHICGT